MITDEERYRILSAVLKLSTDLGRSLNPQELMKFYAETTGGILDETQIRQLHSQSDLKAHTFKDSENTPRIQEIEVSIEGKSFMRDYPGRQVAQRKTESRAGWKGWWKRPTVAIPLIGLVLVPIGWWVSRNKNKFPLVDQSVKQDVSGDKAEVAGRDHVTNNFYQSPDGQQDTASAELHQTELTFKITSMLDDFEQKTQEVVERHGKMIEQIANDQAAKEQYSSGQTITQEFEQTKESRNLIENGWRDCERGVKSSLFRFGATEITDPELKARYESVKQAKDQALNEVVAMTEGFFKKRQHTFDAQVVESVKKSVLEVSP